jgi:hypothetical protein
MQYGSEMQQEFDADRAGTVNGSDEQQLTPESITQKYHTSAAGAAQQIAVANRVRLAEAWCRIVLVDAIRMFVHD